MDRQIQKIASPDYRRIYSDIIIKKHPDKKEKCEQILEKRDLSVLDIIRINSLIFETENQETSVFNQKHRSYSLSDVQEILTYQAKNGLNNTELANHFKLSRNTVAKWKKITF